VANVIHRTREEAVYDGSSGAQIDTHTYHEIGIEVDGVFVPFSTKQGSYVDALVDRGKAAQQAEQHTPSTPSTTATQGDTGAPQSPAVPTTPQSEQSGTAEGQ
jgi:hypothetical protein